MVLQSVTGCFSRVLQGITGCYSGVLHGVIVGCYTVF